jgi:hypothetical protein
VTDLIQVATEALVKDMSSTEDMKHVDGSVVDQGDDEGQGGLLVSDAALMSCCIIIKVFHICCVAHVLQWLLSPQGLGRLLVSEGLDESGLKRR